MTTNSCENGCNGCEECVDYYNPREAEQIHQLRGLVSGVIEMLENCTVSSGVCCCGDSMHNHADPMTCGHSAVDSGEYAARHWLEDAQKALGIDNAEVPA